MVTTCQLSRHGRRCRSGRQPDGLETQRPRPRRPRTAGGYAAPPLLCQRADLPPSASRRTMTCSQLRSPRDLERRSKRRKPSSQFYSAITRSECGAPLTTRALSRAHAQNRHECPAAARRLSHPTHPPSPTAVHFRRLQATITAELKRTETHISRSSIRCAPFSSPSIEI